MSWNGFSVLCENFWSLSHENLNLKELEKKMGLVLNDSKVKTWDGSKSKGKKKKDEAVEETGCWVKFSFGTCMPSRSKVDSAMTGTTISFGNSLLSFFFFGKFLSSNINFEMGIDFFCFGGGKSAEISKGLFNFVKGRFYVIKAKSFSNRFILKLYDFI